MAQTFSEADLCAAFIAAATKPRAGRPDWVAYPETAGFDILLVRQTDGYQVGVEAKLTLNARVVAQSLPSRWDGASRLYGPDYRAVLVPEDKVNTDLAEICRSLGVTVIAFRSVSEEEVYWRPAFRPELPVETHWHGAEDDWFEWCPPRRCEVPDYVPDVRAGASAPVSLTAWKVKAIRLAVLLESRAVTRADFKHLQIDATRWTGPAGWLDRSADGWVRSERTPDFKAQHPRNYAEIAADIARWAPKPDAVLSSSPGAAE